MLLSLSVVVALLVALPEAASMQAPPAAPPGPGCPCRLRWRSSRPRRNRREPPRRGRAFRRRLRPSIRRSRRPHRPHRAARRNSLRAYLPAPPAPPRKVRGRDVNVQIEITISDQLGNAAPDKRVVSMLMADASFGRIRSMADSGIATLNIDARPEILENDRLVVELTIEYPRSRPTALEPRSGPLP